MSTFNILDRFLSTIGRLSVSLYSRDHEIDRQDAIDFLNRYRDRRKDTDE